MFLKSNKGIWFYGISGAGKTLASQFLKKKIKNSFVIDGDDVRKLISFDLGYSIKERKIQAKRVYGIVKLSRLSKIFPIVSTVYMSEYIKKKLEKEKIFLINETRDIKKIKNRKKIYNKKNKNVVGVDIRIPKIKNEFTIENNNSKKDFYKKLIKKVLDK